MPENWPTGFLAPCLRKPLNRPTGFKGLIMNKAFSILHLYYICTTWQRNINTCSRCIHGEHPASTAWHSFNSSRHVSISFCLKYVNKPGTNGIKDGIFCFAHLWWCHNEWASNILSGECQDISCWHVKQCPLTRNIFTHTYCRGTKVLLAKTCLGLFFLDLCSRMCTPIYLSGPQGKSAVLAMGTNNCVQVLVMSS